MASKPVQTTAYPETEGGYVPSWDETETALIESDMYWVTTLQKGVPHTVPVIGIWWDGAVYSCNPRSEQKYKNLQDNPVCQMLTGCSKLDAGLDIAVHGHAEEVTEMEGRFRFARQMAEKYSEPWHFQGTEEDMWVYRLVPTHVRVFHRFNPLGSARYDFAKGTLE